MTGQVISFADIEAAEQVADEVIEQKTYIPLIDLDPKKAAIFLRPKSWKVRRDWFAGIVNGSMEATWRLTVEIEKDHGKAAKDDLMVQGHLGVHEQIARILECLGEEKPTCIDSAVVFQCSMNPAHFLAARSYFNEHGMRSAGIFSYAHEAVFSDGDPLAVFIRLSVAMRPGLADLWRRVKEGDGEDKTTIN